MADHLKLFIALLNLVAGSAIFIHVRNVSQLFSLPFLRPVKRFILYYNILILILLVTKYYSLNLYLAPVADHLSQFRLIIDLVCTWVLAGMTGAVFQVRNILEKRTVSPHWARAGLALLALVSLSYLPGFAGYGETGPVRVLAAVQDGFLDVLFYIQVIMLIEMLVYAVRLRARHRSPVIAWYSVLYLGGYAAFLLFLVVPAFLELVLVLAVLLYINSIPLIWLHVVLKHLHGDFTPDEKQKLMLFNRYNISKRESEIIELILAGKSNAEITKTLYISLHTVKNHIYNIYQKMGINTRYQLLHIFTQQDKS